MTKAANTSNRKLLKQVGEQPTFQWLVLMSLSENIGKSFEAMFRVVNPAETVVIRLHSPLLCAQKQFVFVL